jgi:hypothetical protein
LLLAAHFPGRFFLIAAEHGKHDAHRQDDTCSEEHFCISPVRGKPQHKLAGNRDGNGQRDPEYPYALFLFPRRRHVHVGRRRAGEGKGVAGSLQGTEDQQSRCASHIAEKQRGSREQQAADNHHKAAAAVICIITADDAGCDRAGGIRHTYQSRKPGGKTQAVDIDGHGIIRYALADIDAQPNQQRKDKILVEQFGLVFHKRSRNGQFYFPSGDRGAPEGKDKKDETVI